MGILRIVFRGWNWRDLQDSCRRYLDTHSQVPPDPPVQASTNTKTNQLKEILANYPPNEGQSRSTSIYLCICCTLYNFCQIGSKVFSAPS
jgi:hypothetical protein